MCDKRFRVTVSGRVQGVAFRASTRRKANQLGVTGWVRNLANGDVEITVEGEEDKVKRLISWARNGPRRARVTDLESHEEEYTGKFDTFSVKY